MVSARRGCGRLVALVLVAGGLVGAAGVSAAGAQNANHAPVSTPAGSWSDVGHLLAASQSQVQPGGPAHWVTPTEPRVPGTAYTPASLNWSGELATGTTFTGVSADWVVPTVQPTATLEASSTWIGIDGSPESPGSIIQTGTTQATENGETEYFAWYELYPSAAVVVGGVSPGDQMEASIYQDSGTSWTLSISDVTSGNSASGPLTYTGPGDSAEWIEELPAASTDPQPYLANFGSARFTGASLDATDPGSVVTTPVDMVDSVGNVIAYPGSFSAGSFVITFVPEPTATAVSANPGTSTYGTPVAYSASVTSPGPVPTGTVVFSAGGTQLCTATLSGGSGSCAASNAPLGNDVVTGQYSGDANSDSSSSTTGIGVVAPPPHGYWLVGSDGGIFNFGSANFDGSTGSLKLQRPVVGIVPTHDDGGYWLDASDGGVFSYGDTVFYGSIPGLGLHPAGSGLPNSLNAPIIGMVPSHDDNGYFMVASDGGVFAFGDAHFAGSCPGIGGCSGSAVAVMPDASGNGYWLMTSTGNVYTFGDAPDLGSPGHGTVTSAVATPNGGGYWVLLSDGQVYGYGDAGNLGSPPSTDFNALDPATAIFATSDGGGYWVSSALGAVSNFGDAPNDGGMAGTHLNGSIIAASGF